MTRPAILPVREAAHREAAGAMVWEFFDFLRGRYPDMLREIDAYIARQDVAGQIARWESHFLPPAGECLLALDEGLPLGIVMVRPHQSAGWAEMNRMYVRPAARGRGVGRTLCRAAIAEARGLGYRTLYLDALYRHDEALALYRSEGFLDCHPEDAFGGADARVVHLRLDLAGGT